MSLSQEITDAILAAHKAIWAHNLFPRQIIHQDGCDVQVRTTYTSRPGRIEVEIRGRARKGRAAIVDSLKKLCNDTGNELGPAAVTDEAVSFTTLTIEP